MSLGFLGSTLKPSFLVFLFLCYRVPRLCLRRRVLLEFYFLLERLSNSSNPLGVHSDVFFVSATS